MVRAALEVLIPTSPKSMVVGEAVRAGMRVLLLTGEYYDVSMPLPLVSVSVAVREIDECRPDVV